MASMMLSKRALHEGLKCAFLRRPVVSDSALVNQTKYRSLATIDSPNIGTRDEKSIDVERSERSRVSRRGRRDDFLPAFFTGIDPWDPFNPRRSLNQMLNFMEQCLDTSFIRRWPFRTGWNAREDDNALYLKVEMPGLSKEDVKVCVEGGKEEENDTSSSEEEGQEQGQRRIRQRYSSRIDIPKRGYKLDRIKAEMRHGVLRVTVPRTHEEQRGDVVEVQIDG